RPSSAWTTTPCARVDGCCAPGATCRRPPSCSSSPRRLPTPPPRAPGAWPPRSARASASRPPCCASTALPDDRDETERAASVRPVLFDGERHLSETDIPADDPVLPTGSDYVSDRKFADFPLSQEVLKGIADLGYVNATPVQAAAIEPGLAGRDMLVRAKTGTGKTAAFCVPLVERIDPTKREAQAIVLAPTRELAQQIAEECVALTRYRDMDVAVLVGGLAMGPQEKALAAGAQIIVGTPGRILDHARRKNLDLSTVHLAVLDEADEMLSMGFYEDVTKILDATGKGRQVLLFSATISDETQRLVRNYLSEDHEDIR